MNMEWVAKNPKHRQVVFEMLVLRALWVIILLLVSLIKTRAHAVQVADVNVSMNDYGDTFANEFVADKEKAPAYRREHQFPSAYRGF